MTNKLLVKEGTFEVLLKSCDWSTHQDWEISDTNCYRDEDGRDIEAVGGWVYVDNTCHVNGHDLSISYNQMFDYKKYNTDSLRVCDDIDQVYRFEGFAVVNDDGKEIPPSAFYKSLKDLGFCDLSDVLDTITKQIDETVEVQEVTSDMDISDKELSEITLDNDNAPNVKFAGYQIATVSSEESRGEPGRWTVLNLFVTKGGKYVCQEIGRTRWEHERTKYTVKVCANLEEVKEFFGHRWLAKQLYGCAGIDNAITIE